MHRIIPVVLILIALVHPVWAGWDEGWDAYKRQDYATATTEFMALAEQGDFRAQLTLGIMLVFDEVVMDKGGLCNSIKLDRKVIKWLLKPDVSNKQDLNEAAKWFQDAAEQGDTKAGTLLGHIYDSLGVLFFRFGVAAPGGNLVFEGGVLHVYGRYREGDDVPQGLDEAMKLWRKGGEQGDATAQKSLAFVLGVQNKRTESEYWERKAAEQGDRAAQESLGTSYLHGPIVDKLLAYMWLDLAAKKGDRRAAAKRDEVAKKLTYLGKIDEAEKLVQEWQAKHPWAAIKPGEAQTAAIVPPPEPENADISSCLDGATFGMVEESDPMFGRLYIRVVDVERGSCAWKRGLRNDSAVTSVNGQTVRDLDEFAAAGRKHSPPALEFYSQKKKRFFSVSCRATPETCDCLRK